MYAKAHIHFIGIGGIGMSGIAYLLQSKGYTVSGCDRNIRQASIKQLKQQGCQIFKGHNTHFCNQTPIDIVVYSSAIQLNNPEIKQAQARGIPTIPRALMLAELMRTKFSIAISGSHGKTTTTSMVSHILIEAGLDPSVIAGGVIENMGSNARLGNGNFLIAEADESDKTFLHLHPTLALITNIDLEHLDRYQNIEDIKSTFQSFLSNLPFYGKAFVCTDNTHAQTLLPLNHIKTIRFGTNMHTADICAVDIQLEKNFSEFSLFCTQKKLSLGRIRVPMPGKHNLLNALGASAIAYDIQVPIQTIQQAMTTFKGVDRRFSYKGMYKQAVIYDDYAHHPTEIYYTLNSARKVAQKKLIVVFQPQRYSRTQMLWQEFITVFAHSSVDHLIITDIYNASEQSIENITSKQLVQAIKQRHSSYPVEYISSVKQFYRIQQKLADISNSHDLILFLGAGKVNQIIKKLTS